MFFIMRKLNGNLVLAYGEAPITLSEFEEAHLVLLPGWLAMPHIAPWFPNSDEYLAFARQPPANGEQRTIIQANEPAGYLRWVILSKEILDNAGFPELPAGTADADLFLGEASNLGRGLGVQVLEELSDRLARQGVPLLVLTTSVENKRAQAAFRKAGFSVYREYEPEPFGRCYLMLRWLVQPEGGA